MTDLILRPFRVIMIDPLDPDGMRVAAMAWERATTNYVDGQINQYAYGRRVSVSYGDVNTLLAMNLKALTPDEYDTMQGRLGKVVLFRDRHGRKVYGSYFSIEVVDFRDSEYDIAFEFNSVTYSEEV